jgi:hypothetical protein
MRFSFSWSNCDKNCHIIRRIESEGFYGYVGIHESWEDNINEEEQWAKINIDRKRLSYIEKECLKKSHNYCSTRDSRSEFVFILKTLFPQKLPDVSFANPAPMVGPQLLNL